MVSISSKIIQVFRESFKNVHYLQKKRNQVYSILLYWPDIQSLDLDSNIVIFRKNLQNLVVHDFALLLTPVESKLTN